MIKGWYTVQGADAEIYKNQVGNTYYYDYKTGLMAKGWTIIGGKSYYFDEITGVLSSNRSQNVPVITTTPEPQPVLYSYVGNKNSKIFHQSNCGSVTKMSNANKVVASYDEFIAWGYKKCDNCKP